MTIQFPTGPFVVNLTGTAVSPNLTYQMTVAGVSTALDPTKAITAPATNVGSTTPVTIQIQNTGTARTSIANIATTGAAFSLSDLPVLPAVLGANSALSFTVNFTPPAPGTSTGTLTIGGTRFNLTGQGLGSLLTYSYSSGSTTGPRWRRAARFCFRPCR